MIALVGILLWPCAWLLLSFVADKRRVPAPERSAFPIRWKG